MIHRQKLGNVVWIDANSPTSSEIGKLINEFGVGPVVAHELLSTSFREKAEIHDRYLFLVLHFPLRVRKMAKQRMASEEIDFIVGKDFIITVHYGDVLPLHHFSKFSEIKLSHSESQEWHAGKLLFRILKYILQTESYQLDLISEQINKSEARIFRGEELRTVQSLSNISRDLIDFKRAVRHHLEIFETLVNIGTSFYGASYRAVFDSLLMDVKRINLVLEHNRDMLNDLRTTNDSLLTTRNNETMKHLTMMAFVTFPLSLLSSIFSIEARATPIIGHPYDFWIIIAIMGIVTVAIFLFFRYRRWL